ncbi:MAG TPA: hypothetical protein VIW25_00045 [Nitrososphaeraceae archaeon]
MKIIKLHRHHQLKQPQNNEYMSDHDIDPPQDVTIPLDSEERAIVLSDATQNNLHSPPLPSSGKSIQGPTPGTHTSP